MQQSEDKTGSNLSIIMPSTMIPASYLNSQHMKPSPVHEHTHQLTQQEPTIASSRPDAVLPQKGKTGDASRAGGSNRRGTVKSSLMQGPDARLEADDEGK